MRAYYALKLKNEVNACLFHSIDYSLLPRITIINKNSPFQIY